MRIYLYIRLRMQQKNNTAFSRIVKQLVLFFLFSVNVAFSQKDYQHYVDPFIGTAGHAHTFPGACYPIGMMQLSPDTRTSGWDGCSGYYYADDTIYGFTHTHLSGTGCSDYGDILLMPTAWNKWPFEPQDKFSYIIDPSFYSATFSHKNEQASPGYYSVKLNNNIKADLTVSERAGMHRYIYSKGDSCSIMLDLKHRNEVLYSEYTCLSDTEICGYRETKAWTKNKWIYFDIQFSKPISDIAEFVDNSQLRDFGLRELPKFSSMSAKDIQEHYRLVSKDIKVRFDFGKYDTILVKIGISGISTDNARKNLEHDEPGWDFDGTLKKTKKAWNDYLSK